jgi:hypothetical protein
MAKKFSKSIAKGIDKVAKQIGSCKYKIGKK